MSTKILTIGYLKKFTKGIINLRKEYSNIDDSYELTYDDIITCKFYPYFKDNENPRSIISGLNLKTHMSNSEFIREDEIELLYPKLMDILLKSDNINISPCGGKSNFSTVAIFNIMCRNYDGENVLKKVKCEINPILRSNNDEFTIINHSCEIDGNFGENDRTSIITASYAFKGIIKNSSIELIQKSNEISDWKFLNKTTDNIEITGDNTFIDRNGGVCALNITRYYTEHLYKEDSCGNIIEETEKKGNKEDISKLCILSSTNSNYFFRDSNIITAYKQEIDGNERHCIVSAEYDGFNTSLTITQEKGDSSSYSYTLSFDNNMKLNTKKLTTSLKCEFYVSILSYQNLLVNNNIISSIPSYDLKFVKYDNWYNVSIDEENSDNEHIMLKIEIIENNNNINFDRETELEIYNLNDAENKIKLIINQPKNKLLNTSYELLLDGCGSFTVDTIKDAQIVLKPIKSLLYEDGTTVNGNELGIGNKIICETKTSNSLVLNGSSPRQMDFNGNYIMKPIYHNVETQEDVKLTIKSYICDENDNKISNFECGEINLKGTDLITYDYLFSYDNGEVYYELIWDYNQCDKKTININSLKNKLINGIYNNNEFIPFDYYASNKDFKYFIKDDALTVSPKEFNNSNDDLISTVTIKQNESDKTIKLTLIQRGTPKDEYINLNLSLEVSKKLIEDDIWADYESELIITRVDNDEIVKEIPLNKWWLYPTIENNHDVIYNGNCNFIIGKYYNFKVKKLININYQLYDNEYILLNETYIIESDDEAIELNIKL